MKQLLIPGICALFLACGASSNDRGIPSVSNDSAASGSAYKTNDGFAPAAASSAPLTASTPAAPVPAKADSAAVPATAASAPVEVAKGTKPAAATPAATQTPAKPAVQDNSADVKKGEALISKSDCLACHKIQDKLVGPSYKDVANKYPNNAATINQLVDKIKKGGSGVWGAIPMSPHPGLSDDDAKAMVKYILSLK